MELAFDNMAGKNLWFLILAVGNIFVPVLIVFSLFKRETGKRAIKKGLAILLMGVFLAGSAEAMVHMDTKSVQKDKPVDFESDTLTFNHKTGEAVASGNVIFKQNGSTIQTEKIVYDKNQYIVHVPQEALVRLAGPTIRWASSLRSLRTTRNHYCNQNSGARQKEISDLPAGPKNETSKNGLPKTLLVISHSRKSKYAPHFGFRGM